MDPTKIKITANEGFSVTPWPLGSTTPRPTGHTPAPDPVALFLERATYIGDEVYVSPRPAKPV